MALAKGEAGPEHAYLRRLWDSFTQLLVFLPENKNDAAKPADVAAGLSAVVVERFGLDKVAQAMAAKDEAARRMFQEVVDQHSHINFAGVFPGRAHLPVPCHTLWRAWHTRARARARVGGP